MSKDKSKMKTINDLRSSSLVLKDSLERVMTDLKLLSNGDGDAYWNGTNAYNSVNNLSKIVDEAYGIIDDTSSLCDEMVK